MKIGIVGGIGPASTLDYYRGIVNSCLAQTGSYPSVVIDSIDMNLMCGYFENQCYNGVLRMISDSLVNLKNAGADFAAIASNTSHIIFDRIKSVSPIPVVSIVEETCKYIKENGYKRILVLGTGFTMKSGMYEAALGEVNIKAFTPGENDIKAVNSIIFPNLENGVIINEEKKTMIDIAEKYISSYNIDAVILGCTEIPLMIKENDLSVPAINTAQVHIDSIVRIITG